MRAKALEFYETYRLNDLIEAHWKAEAAGGGRSARFDPPHPARLMPEVVILLPARTPICNAPLRASKIAARDSEIASSQPSGARWINGAPFPNPRPLRWPPLRRALISYFRCGLYFAIEKRGLVVHAVLDLRQSPEWIERVLCERLGQ